VSIAVRADVLGVGEGFNVRCGRGLTSGSGTGFRS
jgi:hypothetical protein